MPSNFNFSQLLFTIDLQIQIHHSPRPTVTIRVKNQTIDQVNAHPSEEVEQIEHPTPTKVHTPPDTTHGVPPPAKKGYEIMKDPVRLSLPLFPPKIPSQPSLSTTRNDHLIPVLSQDNSRFKAQLTSLYMHPTDYIFRLYDKNQDFFTSIASKIMSPYQYWLDNGVKISLFSSIFYAHLFMI